MGDDQMVAELEKFERGEVPSIFGEFEFSVDEEPVSQQAKSQTKKPLKKSIQQKIKNLQYTLTGDLKIEIRWMVYPKHRYESHKAVDIDNIIKPILDSLAGPYGLMVDDTQIQDIGCYWMDWTDQEKHRIDIKVKHSPDEFLKKQGLEFMEIKSGLCLPISIWFENGVEYSDDKAFKAKKIIAETWKKQFELSDKCEKDGLDWHSASFVRPIQRLFHKNKLLGWVDQGYEIKSIDCYL